MSNKANLKFWRRLIVALFLLGGVGFVYSKRSLNNNNTELTQTYPQPTYAQTRDPVRGNVEAAASRAATKQSEPDRKVVDTLNITFRAVGLNSVSPGADQELALNVLNEMKGSAFFDASNTKAVGSISPAAPLSESSVKSEQGEASGTFTFKIVAKLKRPLTL